MRQDKLESKGLWFLSGIQPIEKRALYQMSFYAGIPYTTDPNKARYYLRGITSFKGVERNTHKFNPDRQIHKTLLEFYE